jgi:hypothetical protein
MKVLIKSITVASEYKNNAPTEIEDRRDIEAVVIDDYRNRAKFRLPAVEVDGIINVGGVYELIFARREK